MIPASELLLRLGTSIALGGAIGFERGKHDHPAGLRTHTLVALAAGLFMIVSTQELLVDRPIHPGMVVSFDPSRIASYVVAGIGFIGGGAIARTGLTVKGLTTAASLWLVTAIGLAAGAGLYLAAVVGTTLGLSVLTLFRLVEARPKPRVKRRVRLDLDGTADVAGLLVRLCELGVVPGSLDLERDIEGGTLAVTLGIDHDGEPEAAALLAALERLPGLRRVALTHRDSPDCGEG